MLPTDTPPPHVLPPELADVAQEADSLFERHAWIYAFFREYLFHDDTNGIAAALWRSLAA